MQRLQTDNTKKEWTFEIKRNIYIKHTLHLTHYMTY